MGGRNPAHTQLEKKKNTSTDVHLLKWYSGTVKKLLKVITEVPPPPQKKP